MKFTTYLIKLNCFVLSFQIRDRQLFSINNQELNSSGFMSCTPFAASTPQHKSSCRQYIKECEWLYSNQTLFMNTGIWITYSVDMTGNIIFLLLFFFSILSKAKTVPSWWSIQNRQWDIFGSWTIAGLPISWILTIIPKTAFSCPKAILISG